MKVSDKQFIRLAKSCASTRQLLNKLGLTPAGGNYETIKRRCKRLGIQYNTNRAWNKGKKLPPRRDVKSYLVLNGPLITVSALRRRLIKEGLKDACCENCGLIDWLGKPINLHLDHINGNRSDNRLNNLRILCPNCHSQTSTYGKMKKSSH